MSLIMPKHTRGSYEHQAVLKVHIEKNTWVSSADLISGLHAEYVRLGKETTIKTDTTDYTKDAQIPRYFLLIRRSNPHSKTSPTIITPEGRNFYQALLNSDYPAIHEILVDKITTLTFGRNTQGCGSDSDVEPLGVFFHAAYDLDGITNSEYGYLLQELDNAHGTYATIITQLRQLRANGIQPQIAAASQASNLKDWKTILFLSDMQMVSIGADTRAKVSPAVDRLYRDKLRALKLTNVPPLKGIFKQWLSENGYGVSVDSYPRSIEAVSMPLSQPMSKTTGSWEGLYEYVFDEKPRIETFSVCGAIDYLRTYRRLNDLLIKGLTPPVPGVDPVKHQELINYTMLSGNSIDKGRLYCANEAYKKFLLWLHDNKSKLGLSYTEEEKMINKYLSAIRAKPFILLAGISGTGKSRLVRQLARGCCPAGHDLGKNSEGAVNSAKKPGNFEMIPVRPNWHDSTELMGYVTRITDDKKPKYVIKPFVKFLVKAAIYKDVPFFLCLDEMNLAPVEQYFAEYLSVVETRKVVKDAATGAVTDIVSDVLVDFDQPEIDIVKTAQELMADWLDFSFGVGEDEQPTITVVEKVPGAKAVYDQIVADKGVRIPRNFVVMGTVNMDETTCSFSRKVLDRAMTFELNEVDMDEGLAANNEIPYGAIPPDSAFATAVEGFDFYSANEDLCKKIKEYLETLNAVLDGTPFKFAYRSRNEIMLYCIERMKSGVVELPTALDEATSMKILSRIEGDEDKLTVIKRGADGKPILDGNGRPVRVGLLDVLIKDLPAALKVANGNNDPNPACEVCAKKLEFMQNRLAGGFTNFFV